MRVSAIVVLLVVGLAIVNFVGLLRSTQCTRNETKSDFAPLSSKRRETPSLGTAYQPASLEQYLVDNAYALGYSKTRDHNMASGCDFWRDESGPMYNSAQVFKRELKNYQDKAASFQQIPDLRTLFSDDETNRDDVCMHAELDPENGLLEGFFNRSRQLSYSSSGYVEPLFPPMRHPDFCFDNSTVLSMSYLVHDFGTMCRRLKKTSRIVLFDLGASLDYHGDPMLSPALYLVSLYRKFGFPFDHIYAFEITPSDSQEVFDKVPDDMLTAYHWINVGVSPEVNSRNNPWNMLKKYNEDDLIIVKLDVDTASVEMPLARQLLKNKQFHCLVDHFYFEHHVKISEMDYHWSTSREGSIKQSLELFQGLRKKGIPAHFWI